MKNVTIRKENLVNIILIISSNKREWYSLDYSLSLFFFKLCKNYRRVARLFSGKIIRVVNNNHYLIRLPRIIAVLFCPHLSLGRLFPL